ncbi:MAG: cell division protein FtsX [Methylophaga sp.]|nr:MAG: cell division protein FtsX [Methylophaga sp.]
MKNLLLRHLQAMFYSLGQMWRQPVSSLMTVLVIGIALALPAGLFVLLHNIEQVSEQWDEATQISLFLQQQTSAHQAEQLTTQLKTWPEIANVQYQSSEQSLAEFRQLSGLGDLLDTLPTNPLPAVIVVNPIASSISTNAISDLLSRLDNLKEVEQAQLDMEWLQRLRTLNQTGQRGIAILGVLLSLSVLLVIGNTIRLAILSRQSEIKVIKLVGGTNAFARRPFLYTGFWYGILGGIIAWITLLLTLWSLNGPINQLASQYDSQFTLQWLIAPMLLILPITGLILGVLGAWLAVGRHLNAIEPN